MIERMKVKKSKWKDAICGIAGLTIIGIIFPPLFMVIVALFGVYYGGLLIGWCYRKFAPTKYREEMRKAQQESVALSKTQDKWFWDLPRYRVGRETYIDISGLPFMRGSKAGLMAGKYGWSIITKYMRETGKWEKILEDHGMCERCGQVYRRMNGMPSYVPPPRQARQDDEEPDDVELAAVAMMMEDVM